MSYGFTKSGKDKAALIADIKAQQYVPESIKEDIAQAVRTLKVGATQVIVVEANGHHSYTEWSGDGTHQYKVRRVDFAEAPPEQVADAQPQPTA